MFAHMPDAEGENQRSSEGCLGAVDRCEEIGSRFFGHPFQAEELFPRQKVEIGRIVDQPLVTSCVTIFSPRPSISSPPREAKWAMCSRIWAGQAMPMHRWAASPSRRTIRNRIRGRSPA